MPKRRVTILTSSGCETSLGMSRASLCIHRPGLCAIACQYVVYLLVGEVIVEIVVYLKRRGPAANADTLHLFKREETVRGDAFMPNPQLVLQVLKDVVPAAQ